MPKNKNIADFLASVKKFDIEYTPKANAYLAKLDDHLYNFLSRFIKIKKLPHTRLRPGVLRNQIPPHLRGLDRVGESGNEAQLQFVRDTQVTEQLIQQGVDLNEEMAQQGAALNEEMAQESMDQYLADQNNSNWGDGFGGF